MGDAFYLDLDGTLIDSAPGIIMSLTYALEACGVDAPASDWTRFIGPPLPQMLKAALPHFDPALRDAVILAFRRHYEDVGLFQTTPYPGIPEALAAIAGAGLRAYVVTNKPQRPAEAIMRHLGLDLFVQRIVGGDPTGRATKLDRAATLAWEEGVYGGTFLGDALDDLLAAERIGARFILAGWGYGAANVCNERPDTVVLAQPKDIVAAVVSQRFL